MILYFSATGNSKYVAELLGEYLEDEVVCVNKLLMDEEIKHYDSQKPWVFVFPVFVSKIPTVFEQFIERTQFMGNKKAYFIPTCQAASGSSANGGKRLCKKKGWEFLGGTQINMPQNYIMSFFKMQDEEECRRRIYAAKETVKKQCEYIEKESFVDGTKLTSRFENLGTLLVDKMCAPYFALGTKKFHTSNACVGCGLCEQVCPMNNIVLRDGKPWWGRTCIQCSACVNRCPREAVEYGKITQGKMRFYCEKYILKNRPYEKSD